MAEAFNTMPLYFFSLTDAPWPYYSGEDLPNDEAARKRAEQISKELTSKKQEPVRVQAFSADGKRVS